MHKWMAKNTLIIPGASKSPSQQPKGKHCPFCKEVILTLKPIKNKESQVIKYVCPSCGKELNPVS